MTLCFESGQQTLADITLDVEPGEHICILGPNGSGKSTLASVMCGLLAPDEGEVTLAGIPVFKDGEIDLDAYRRARRSFGLVFQNPDDEIVSSIVEDDVAFGPENLGLPREEIARRVRANLHHVAMQDYAHADPSKLSGGQKQRVAIAGALALEPSVLVFDEPGALLDVRGRRSIMKAMDRLEQAGVTVVHITHFMEEALAAHRVLVLSQGRIVEEGSPEEVFSHVETFRSLGLEEPPTAQLAALLQERGLDVAWTCDRAELRKEILELAGREGAGSATAPRADAGERPPAAAGTPASPSAGGHAGMAPAAPGASSDAAPAAGSPATPSEAPASAEALVDVSHVFFSYGSRGRRGEADRAYALDDVSLAITRGESVALVGQTGSGKSTLLRLICALETPDEGCVRICGLDTAKKRERRQLRSHIGYVMQHPERQLFAETVAEDVAFGPTNLGLPADEVEKRVSHSLELVGLTGKRDASPFELSGGQQRLAAIAGVLAMQPEILVLDEPIAGLDPRGRSGLRSILARLNAQGVTIIQVTHSMEGAALARRVVVLNNSHILFDGSPRDVFARDHAGRLRASGLDLPESLSWAYDLEDAGLGHLGQPLTLAALADSIAQEVL